MKDQRKRVAKRLASGLLAGALALGGLAISGGSVSAKTPTSPSTYRISGADRYATAVAVARKMAVPSDGLVIASGETPYDALAASVLTTANRPMLLVQKDTIPTAVADYLSDFKAEWVTPPSKVYVVGGSSVISDATLTAIKSAVTTASDLTPPTVVRVSGSDRYGTAQAISQVAGVTAASDTLIIVNGENDKWADSVSAAPLAAWKGWPIVTTTGASLAASSKAVVDAYIAMPGSAKKFLIVGGTSAVSTAVEEYLTVTKGVAVANVRRVSGTDRYATNVVFNLYLAGLDGPAGTRFTGSKVALVSGESPWDALTASAWSATNGVHVVLTPSAGGNFYVNTLISTLAGIAHGGLTVGTPTTRLGVETLTANAFNDTYGTDTGVTINLARVAFGGNNQIDELWVVGGSTVVPNAAKTGYAAQAAGDLTATMTCSQGSPVIGLTLSGALSPFEAVAFASVLNEGRFTLNGAAIAGANIDIADDGTYELDNGGSSYTIVLNAGLTATGIVKFLGWEERTTDITGDDVTNHKARRSISAATCTPGVDSTIPSVVSFRAVSGSAVATANNATTSVTHSLDLKFSEPMTVGGLVADGTLAANTKPVTVGAATNASSPVIVDFLNASRTQVRLKFANGDTIHQTLGKPATGTQVVTLNPSLFTDSAGNALAAAPEAATSTDAVLPTLTVVDQECVLETNVLGEVETNSTMTAGSLVITPAISAYKGAKAAGWTLTVVNQRGIVAPKMVVDATSKTVTVTADQGYHTPADLATVLANSLQSDAGFGGLVGGGWKLTDASIANTATLTPTLTAAPAVGGLHYCAVVVSGSEPFSVGAGLTVAVGGLSAGYVSNIVSTGVGVPAISAQLAAGEGDSHKWSAIIWFRTKILGTGTIVGAADNTGFTDKSANIQTTPISFTVS